MEHLSLYEIENHNHHYLYFLTDDAIKEIVYVGQTANLIQRINQHDDKPFSDIYYYVGNRDDIILLEEIFIFIFECEYNKTIGTKLLTPNNGYLLFDRELKAGHGLSISYELLEIYKKVLTYFLDNDYISISHILRKEKKLRVRDWHNGK